MAYTDFILTFHKLDLCHFNKMNFTHFRENHNNSSCLYVQGKWREINHMSGAQIIPTIYVNIMAAVALAPCISR